jgi:pyruvate/2-oxoglutarate dehydrogenase complex dihydrolipoamide acyltransferase (E2) component
MSFNQPQGEMSMKNTTKIAKLVFAAMLAIFCLACEEKEKALAEAIEATARAQAEAEAAEAAFAKAEAEAEAAEAASAKAKAEAEAEEAFAKATRAAAKIKCTPQQTGGVKLLECITDEEGEARQKFEYDKQNRLVKMYICHGEYVDVTTTITYNTDNSVMLERTHHSDYSQGVEVYVRKGNTITVDTIAFTINEDGYIAKDKNYTYQYQDGNLTGTEHSGGNTSDYSYDDKKSPFSNTTTPKWLLQDLLEDFFYANKNNISACDQGGENGSYQYLYTREYDSDGFTTKQTREWDYEGEEGTEIIRFTYRSGK